MTTLTSRNVPLAETTDPADIAARVNPVAQLAHDRPGVSALTTTQRNALAGAELWDGRLVLNTTTDRLNRYDLGTTTWVELADMQDIATLLATTGTPGGLGTAARGISNFAARADHVHPGAATQTHTPTITATSGTLTTASGITRYNDDGVMVKGRTTITITNAGDASQSLVFTLPSNARVVAGTPEHMGTGRESQSTGVTLSVNRQSSTQAAVIRFDNATVIASGRTCHLTWTYEK